ncbi:reverse transcriptase domain-containing protein [Tanacetum coccineum]
MSSSSKSTHDYSRKYQRAILEPWRQSHNLPPSPPSPSPNKNTPTSPIATNSSPSLSPPQDPSPNQIAQELHHLSNLLEFNLQQAIEATNPSPPNSPHIPPPTLDQVNFHSGLCHCCLITQDLFENVEPKQIILDLDDQPVWESAKTIAPTPNSVIIQLDVDDNFVINSTHLNMIRENKFDGYLQAGPHDHIREFLTICNMFRYGETQSEAVKLLIFPFSLCDEAKTWFNELNEESITSWDQMRRAFINRFFPSSLFNHLLLEIRNFSQLVLSWMDTKIPEELEALKKKRNNSKSELPDTFVEIESFKSSAQHSVNDFVVINIPEEDVEPKQIILDPDDQPMWESAKTVAPTPNSAIVQIDVDDNFVINSTHLKLVCKYKFDGYLRADLHDHFREFLAICDMFKYGETQSEAVNLLIFPYSLSDKAKHGLTN